LSGHVGSRNDADFWELAVGASQSGATAEPFPYHRVGLVAVYSAVRGKNGCPATYHRRRIGAGSNSSDFRITSIRTIIDTHVTTVVSAVFLFLFGTGPVRGFALTLTVGLIANVFTSIYVSRAIFDYHLSKMDRNARLSI